MRLQAQLGKKEAQPAEKEARMSATRVQPSGGMDDEQFMRHMERRHADALKLEFKVEPDRSTRRLRSGEVWRIFHDKIHELDHEGKYDDHFHTEQR